MFTSINHVSFMSHCDSVFPQNNAQVTYKQVYQSMLPICTRSDKEEYPLFYLNLSLWCSQKTTFSVETKRAPLPIIECFVIHMFYTMIVFQLFSCSASSSSQNSLSTKVTHICFNSLSMCIPHYQCFTNYICTINASSSLSYLHYHSFSSSLCHY